MLLKFLKLLNFRWIGRWSLLFAALLLCFPSLGAERLGKAVTLQPQDNGWALVNPGMGWTFHFYSNAIENYGSNLEPSDTLDDWPGLSTIYLRVPWSFLEPQEGWFNWSLFDTPAQRWIAKGKKIAIRVTCCESWWQYATPKWVRDAGAHGIEFEFGKGPRPGGPLWEPDYTDPVFLQKLDHFLAALARRYDGVVVHRVLLTHIGGISREQDRPEERANLAGLPHPCTSRKSVLRIHSRRFQRLPISISLSVGRACPHEVLSGRKVSSP